MKSIQRYFVLVEKKIRDQPGKHRIIFCLVVQCVAQKMSLIIRTILLGEIHNKNLVSTNLNGHCITKDNSMIASNGF